MKKTLLLQFLTLIVFSLNAQMTYTISGQLANQNNETITLSYYEGNQLVENRVTATNGSFELTGPAPTQPTVARLQTSLDRNLYLGEQRTSMYLPAAPLELVVSADCKLTVSGDAKDIHLANVSGDAYNESLTKFHLLEAPFTKKMDELRDYFSQAKKMGLGDEVTAIGKRMYDVYGEIRNLRKIYVSTNPTDFVSGWLLSVLSKDLPLEELKSLYDGLSDSVKKTSYGVQVADRIKKNSNVKQTTK